jgi:putative sterol carrier protein
MMKAFMEVASRESGARQAIDAFFESIGGVHPEVPNTVSGSLRFDLENGKRSECWRVTIDKGVVSSERSDASADCLVHTDKATWEAIIQGRANALAALLRGAMRVEGEVVLMAYFRRLFTEPAAVHEAQRLAKNIGRRA